MTRSRRKQALVPDTPAGDEARKLELAAFKAAGYKSQPGCSEAYVSFEGAKGDQVVVRTPGDALAAIGAGKAGR